METITLTEWATDSGSECSYYALDNNRGLKVFGNEDDARIAFETQQQAASKKAGSKVYPACNSNQLCFEWYEPDDIYEIKAYCGIRNCWSTEYGYYTQIADYPPMDIFDEQNMELYDLLTSIFGEWHDLRVENTGIIDGKLVCIDFGAYSTGERCYEGAYEYA